MKAVASLTQHLQEQIDLGWRENYDMSGESADVHARRKPAAALPNAAPGPSSSKGAASQNGLPLGESMVSIEWRLN
jgi:hypothetical protein